MHSSSDVGTPGTLSRAPVAAEPAGRPRRPTRTPSDPPSSYSSSPSSSRVPPPIPSPPMPPSRSERRARSRPPAHSDDRPRPRDRSVPRDPATTPKSIELNAKKTMDYRVSRVAILCRDCGSDVGFFPARHRCGHPNPTEEDDAAAPPVPPLPNAAEGGESSISTAMTSLWTKFQGLTVASRTSADSSTTGTTATPPNGAPGSRGSADSTPVSPQDGNAKEEQGMWAVWNKLKAQIGATTGNQTSDDDPEEVEKALRDYYAKKGGPMPEFLKEQAKSATKMDDLDRFEQRAATLGRSGRRPSSSDDHHSGRHQDPYYDAPPRGGRYDDRPHHGRSGGYPEDDHRAYGSSRGGYAEERRGSGGRGGYAPHDDDGYYGRPPVHAATMSRADRGHHQQQPAYGSPARGDPYYDQGADRRQYQQSGGYRGGAGAGAADYHAGGYATVGRGYR
ncbi:hypothetical protein BCR44DRAFT_1432784 [Catenaria anguillulae PL171]|uniref:Uncharacterized protein n=1 Tax=Catenaria anguillulae PL171 TaxID=765915 RepID=A0A1Y2HNI1_9FUNG|nr:hypothetical protein BCR44DRAFT_1432784 [Catenaria anguillulae PL171]